MNKSLPLFLKEEFIKFRGNLVSVWSIQNEKLAKWEPQLKSIHKRYLSLACASTIVGYKVKHKEYVHSIVEASHLSMVLTLKGLKNPACVLLRQTIEMDLKFIFFLTHPVEYSWAITRNDYRELTFQNLLEYLGRTDEHKMIVKKGINISKKLNEHYQLLSRYVHVHSKGFMGYKTLNIKGGSDALKELDRHTKELWSLITMLLIIFLPKPFLAASLLEQRLIKNCMTQKQKEVLHYILSK